MESRVERGKNEFGYGESNPELPRISVSPIVRGGNVSRYTISDVSFFALKDIHNLAAD